MLIQSDQGLKSKDPIPIATNVFGEENLDNDNITPEQFHLLFNKPRRETFDVNEAATSLLQVASDISKDAGLSPEEAGFGLRSFNVESSKGIRSRCPWSPAPTCNPDKDLMYRSADGRCNNFKEPNYGRATTPFQRILDPEYSAGSLASPRIAKSGLDLPSARKVIKLLLGKFCCLIISAKFPTFP